MKRYKIWLFAILLLSVNLVALPKVTEIEDFGVPGQFRGDENHDLRFLLGVIRSEREPFKWFTSDWPLYNGFYRPITTLSFELDNWMFDVQLSKMKVTNWIVCTLCAFLLFWFVWELFRDVNLAFSVSLLFSIWQTGIHSFLPIDMLCVFLASFAVIFAFAYLRQDGWKWISVFGLLIYLSQELQTIIGGTDALNQTLFYRVELWPVGRTATLFALFALICLASYCRFERERRTRWYCLSLVSLLLCFGCYEQAVVVAPALIGCAFMLRLQRVEVRWLFHLIPFLLTAVYLGLHRSFLNWEHPYHLQAGKPLKSAFREYGYWLFPNMKHIHLLGLPLDPLIGAGALFYGPFWIAVVTIFSNAVSVLSYWKNWKIVVFGLLMALGTYLPLGLQQNLAHYFYFSMMFRAIFVVGLMMIVAKIVSETKFYQKLNSRFAA